MPDDFLSRLEYDPAAPDVESIMRQVRAYLRSQTGADVTLDAPHGDPPSAVDRRALDDLRQAQAEVDGLQIAPTVAPSAMPVIGGLLDRARLEFHRLVVFYVGRFAGAQGRFNDRTADAIEGLAAARQDDAGARVGQLEARVASLEARLKAFESDAAPGAADTKRG